MSLKDPWNQFRSPHPIPPTPPPDPSERELNGIPDLLQPLEGWRVWKVLTLSSSGEELPLLRSVVLDTPWAPRRRTAAEHSFDLSVQCQGLLNSSCTCGLYAFKDPADAFLYLSGVRDRLHGMPVDTALGTVSLWGKVVDCERGYRAQYAYPRRLYLPATACWRVREVSSAFGVSVGVYASQGKRENDGTEAFKYVDQRREAMTLRRSRVLESKESPYKISFYDPPPLTGSPSPAR